MTWKMWNALLFHRNNFSPQFSLNLKIIITNFTKLNIVVLLFMTLLKRGFCFEIDLTFDLQPSKYECFFQQVKENHTLEVEYQVLDGGDMDINFVLEDPNGVPLVAEKKKRDGVHTEVAPAGEGGGVYKICFDNSFSSFSHKLIYLEVIVESDKGEDYYDELELKRIEFTTEEDVEDYEGRLDDIQSQLNSIKSHLSRAIHFQESRRATETRHRNVVETNFTRVNAWSSLQSIVMLLTAALQTYLIRSLFDNANRLHRLWT